MAAYLRRVDRPKIGDIKGTLLLVFRGNDELWQYRVERSLASWKTKKEWIENVQERGWRVVEETVN